MDKQRIEEIKKYAEHRTTQRGNITVDPEEMLEIIKLLDWDKVTD
jgi:hypothetical protein